MTGSVSSIVMLGLGNGTFNGSVGLVVTLGYGIEQVIVAPTQFLHYTAPLRNLDYTATQRNLDYSATER